MNELMIDENISQIVIFDTNAYRYLTTKVNMSEIKKHVESIKKLERENGIVAIMNPVVIKELCYHIAGKRNSSHHMCLKALKAMGHHCSTDDNFAVLPDFDLNISKSFFQQVDPDRERIDLQLGRLVFELTKSKPSKVLTRYQYNLRQIRKYIVDNENNFIAVMKEVVKKIDPDSNDFSLFKNDRNKRNQVKNKIDSEEFTRGLAKGYVQQAYINLFRKGLIHNYNNRTIEEMTDTFISIYSVPLALYRRLFKHFVGENFDLEIKDRANYLWDIHILFALGGLHEINGRKVFMVSEDRELTNAAKDAGVEMNIYSYSEYIEFITGTKNVLSQPTSQYRI